MARLDFSVSVFQRRIKNEHQWWAIGFGASPIYTRGRSLSKVRDRFLADCRERVRSSTPAQVPALQLVRGRRLYHLRLELTVRHEEGRTRFNATVPVIVEPRPLGPKRSVHIAYHPLRPQEWFPVDERSRERLQTLANAVFAQRWSEAKLGPEQLEGLRRQGSESLQLVAFRAEPKSLFAQLPRREGPQMARIGTRRRRKGTTLLSELGFDMTRKGIDDELHPGMPRTPYREQLRQLLCGGRKAPVLLIGPPGVGKTTLVHRMVLDLLEADGWEAHQNLDRVHHVWQISGRRIIAGMSYIGQWEQRCVELLEETYAKQVILWAEDLCAWGRIGESHQNDRSLSDFFRGPIARGELTLVAECTPEQYQQLQGDASGFANLFTTIHVEPTDASTTMRMLVHEARALELSHGCAYDSRVFRSIYELSGSLYSGSAYPGKALELVRALASAHRVSPEAAADYSLDELLMRSEQRRPVIGSSELINLLSERTGMPKLLLTPHESLAPEQVAAAFSTQVMGQAQAVGVVRDLILRIKSGLCDPNRPYGVYLFSGPTGTGKTEMAKALAAYLFGDESRLVRLDMSEYNVPGSAARLIGDRFSPRGVLTSRVRAQPFCVVLLDEVEKAHPSVLNLMLQLFDDGRLSDANGDVADFRHSVVIMTSNLGAGGETSIGFGGDQSARILLDIAKAVSEFFPPELFNRIDRVVQFRPLARPAAEAIARKELSRLLSRRGLTERNTFVKATEAVLHEIVREGFNARDGARSLKRWLEDTIGSLLVATLTRSAAASMRILWLYSLAGSGRASLRVHEEALREAEAIPSHSRVSELLEQPNAALLEQVPAALRFLRGLEQSPRLERLSLTLARLLESFNADNSDNAEATKTSHESDALYNLEMLRTEVHELREALELHAAYDQRLSGRIEEREGRHEGLGEQLELDNFSAEHTRDRDGLPTTLRQLDRRALKPSLPLRERKAMLRAIADVWFLERALERAGDPRQHVVFLELARVGDPRKNTRFEQRRHGLIEALANAYVGRGRGELESFACVPRGASGPEIRAFPDGATRPAPHGLEQQFEHELTLAPELMVLQLVGPSVRDYFAGESGSQVFESLAGDHEIVRVRVLEAEAGAEPRALIERTLAGREAFVRALEAGEALPPNPDAMLPIIRRFKLEEPRAGRPPSIEVEDYPLSHVSEHNSEQLEPVLELLWLMRVGVELGEERERRRTDPGLRSGSVADPLPPGAKP